MIIIKWFIILNRDCVSGIIYIHQSIVTEYYSRFDLIFQQCISFRVKLYQI